MVFGVDQRLEILQAGRTVGCSMSIAVRAIAFPFKESSMSITDHAGKPERPYLDRARIDPELSERAGATVLTRNDPPDMGTLRGVIAALSDSLGEHAIVVDQLIADLNPLSVVGGGATPAEKRVAPSAPDVVEVLQQILDHLHEQTWRLADARARLRL